MFDETTEKTRKTILDFVNLSSGLTLTFVSVSGRFACFTVLDELKNQQTLKLEVNRSN